MVKLLQEEEYDFFEQYEAVVFAVMKQMNFSRMQSDYDDFAQQGRIKLVEAYTELENAIQTDKERYQFVNYAMQKIRWHFLDILRKRKKKNDNERAWAEEQEKLYGSHAKEYEEIEDLQFIESFKPYLSEVEYRYLFATVIERLTPTELAKKENIRRETIYKRRQRVRTKLGPLLGLETEKGA